MSIAKKSTAKGPRWYVYRTIHDNGVRRQVWHGGYATEAEAKVADAKLTVSRHNGTYRPPTDETVDMFLEEWLSRKARNGDHRPRTSEYYRETISLYVVPEIGSLRLTDVRPVHIQRVVDRILRGARRDSKPATVHRRYRIVAAAFADAVKTERLAVTPCRGIGLPKLVTRKLRPPSPEDVARILGAAVDPYRLPLSIAAWTGLRRGEVLGLRWRDIDLDERVLFVRQAASEVGGEVRFDRPKSDGSERPVPLTISMASMLRQAKIEQVERRLRIGKDWRDLDLVVDNGDGAPMSPYRLTRYTRHLLGSLGMPGTLHDLRHSAVTVLLAAGVPVAIVSEVVGHASVAFTVKRYGHLMPEHLRPAAEAMERAYGG